LGAVGLLVATGLVVAGAIGFIVLLELTQPLDALLGVASFSLALMVVSLTIAGTVLSGLDALTVLTVTGLTSAPAALAAARRRGKPRGPIRILNGRPWRTARAHPWTSVLLALAVGGLGWRLVLAYVLPPYGFDALSYHLPTVAEWLQTDRLSNSPLNVCCAHYPADGELAFVWQSVFLGNDTLVDTTQVGFAVLGALAVAGLARLAGVTVAGAVGAAALFALTPILLAQSNTAHVDVMATSTFLTAVYFLLRYLDHWAFARSCTGGQGTPDARLLLVSGLGAGFALGTKLNGPLVVVALACVLLTRLGSACAHRRLPLRAALGAVLTFALGALLVGGFWYFRDWVSFGNPVYPFRVEVLGIELFSGPRSPASALTAPPLEFRDEPTFVQVVHSWGRDILFWKNSSYSHGQRLGGLGPAWSYLGVPLLGAFAAVTAVRRRALFVNLLLPIGLIFSLQPYRWWSRFTIVLAALGAIAIAYFVEVFGRRTGRWALSIASVAFAAIGLAIASANVDPGLGGRPIGPGNVLELVNEPASERTLGRIFYRDYAWVDGFPDATRIAVDPRHVHLLAPLIGPHFARRVLPLPRRTQMIERFLIARRIDVLVVARGSKIGRWVSAHQQLLAPISRGRHVDVYRVTASS
jgi:hypothetical protein